MGRSRGDLKDGAVQPLRETVVYALPDGVASRRPSAGCFVAGMNRTGQAGCEDPPDSALSVPPPDSFGAPCQRQPGIVALPFGHHLPLRDHGQPIRPQA